LSKFWKTSYELPAIYTGGKILFSAKTRQILSIANFTIFVYDIETKQIAKKITHVFILLDIYLIKKTSRKMRK